MTAGASGELLAGREAAVIAGVVARTLARWAGKGWTGVTRTAGGRRRYDRAEIEAIAVAGEMVTPAYIAGLSRVSRQTSHRWLQEGKFPGAVQRPGGRWLVPRAEAEAGLHGEATGW